MKPADFSFRDPNWKPHQAKLPAIKQSQPRELGYAGRDYQIRRFKSFDGKTRTLTVAPTGSGKSLMQIFDAAREIIQTDYERKQIFIVPQLNIGYGFTEKKHPMLNIDGKIYHWEITTNCCEENDGSVESVRKFLLEKRTKKSLDSFRKQDVLGGVTCVATYAAFIKAFQNMSNSEKKRAIKNTSFRIDEIQHVSGVSEDDYEMNRLGEFCKYLLDQEGFLHVMTALFYRGNKQAIIDTDYLSDFEIFRVPFMEHWNVLGLRELRQNYVCYENSTQLMNQIIDSVKEESNEPALIIVPSDGNSFFKTTNKTEWVKTLVEKLEQIYGPKLVLDLVRPDRQKRDKDRLMSDDHDFQVAVTCMIGREGTDWPPCSRIHNASFDRSVHLAIQKLGRSLRDHKDKQDVKMVNYIEYFAQWDSPSDKIRQNISDMFNAVIVSSMLDDMFYPILMPTLPFDDDEEDTEPVKYVSLEDVYGSKRNDVIEEMLQAVLAIPEDLRTPDAINEVIEDIIESFDDYILENVSYEVLKERLRKELLRRQNPNNPDLRLDGMIVDFVREHGWDVVVRTHIAPHSPFEGRANTNDLQRLQQFLGTDWKEKVEEASRIGFENLDKDSSLYRFMAVQRAHYKRQTENA